MDTVFGIIIDDMAGYRKTWIEDQYNRHLERCIAPVALVIGTQQLEKRPEPDPTLPHNRLLVVNTVEGECGQSRTGQQTNIRVHA